MMDGWDMDELLGWLAWTRDAGSDAVLSEVPIDWLARGDRAPGADFRLMTSGVEPGVNVSSPAPAGHAAVAPRPRPQTPIAPSAAGAEARRMAPAVQTLAELRSALEAFNGCALKATAKNLCFYRGAESARLMVIGEAPGREEDIEGRPFVGRAGQLLDKMLAAIKLAEADVHITNIVYWRPPGNRTPTPQEALSCRPFLDRQMALVRPEIIVTLGGAATNEVFSVADGIMKLRGRWRQMQIDGRPVSAIATLHPAYLLRTPAAKQLAWIDLLAIKARLDGRG